MENNPLVRRWIIADEIARGLPKIRFTGGTPLVRTGKNEFFKPGGDIDAVLPFEERKSAEQWFLKNGFEKIYGVYTIPGYASAWGKRGVHVEVLFSLWYDTIEDVTGPDSYIIPKEWRYAYYLLFPPPTKVRYYLEKDLFDVDLFISLVARSPFRELVGWHYRRIGLVQEVWKFARPLPLAISLAVLRNMRKKPEWLFLWMRDAITDYRKKISSLALQLAPVSSVFSSD